MVKCIQVETEAQLEPIRELFIEYADAWGIDLSFQNFYEELVAPPVEYPPDGCLILVVYEVQITGCVVLIKITDGICEMKRFYARPD